MQLGFSIYLPIMLVLMSTQFHYDSFQLGVFNGIMGLGFVVGMTVVYKQLLKIWSVYKIGITTLITTGIILCVTPFIYWEYPIIGLSFLGYMFDMIAYTALLTTFSFAVSKKAQGWVMGISGSVMAAAWTVTGFSTNLIPYIGARGVILIGGVLMLLSAYAYKFTKSDSKQTDN